LLARGSSSSLHQTGLLQGLRGGWQDDEAASEKFDGQHAEAAKTARAVLILGFAGNLTFDEEAKSELARRCAAVTRVEPEGAGAEGPFSLPTGGADNAVCGGTSVAEQDKNRRTIVVLMS
jgi:hypothetical protein